MPPYRPSLRAPVPRGPHAVRPPRGWTFPATVCALLDAPVPLAEIARALAEYPIMREAPGAPGEYGWTLGGPSLLVAYRPEVNGYVQVDLVSRPWPDAMGSPKDDTAPLFAAWAMGHFGPSSFPGALERAMRYTGSNEEALREAGARHRAFLRVRLSYVFGADANDPVHPSDRDPLDELRFVSHLQAKLLELPLASCAFNPSGELLVARESLVGKLQRDLAGERLAVDAWANVRMFRSQGAHGDWLVFDTVGMDQLAVRDHEAVIPFGHPSVRHVVGLLYSMAAYDAEQGGVLGANDTASDFDEVPWVAHSTGDAIVQPPRSVVRWAPQGIEVPAMWSGAPS